jgi:hypothetical protein
LTRCVKDLYDERLVVMIIMIGEYTIPAGVYWLDTENVATAPSTTVYIWEIGIIFYSGSAGGRYFRKVLLP